MTTSQSDVDKVMAAFGAAPLNYRPSQTAAAGSNAPAPAPHGVTPANARGATFANPSASPGSLSASKDVRILPGAGGLVREVFPLLSRAVPGAGDLRIGAIKRPGDEVPEQREPVADQVLAARLQAGGTLPVPDETPLPAPPAAADAPAPVASDPAPRVVPLEAAETSGRPRPARPAQVTARERSPAQWDQQAQGPAQAAPPPSAPMPVPVQVAASAVRPLPPLRSHADLIRPIVERAPRADAQPAGAPSTAAMPAPLQPAAQPAAPQVNDAQPAPPPGFPAAAHAAAAYAAAAYPPPPAYPPYYGPSYPPQGLPPQGMPPYPMPPGAQGWPQPGYPPPYSPPYPSTGAGYPPGYPPAYPPPGAGYPPAYPAPYPYGYPQPPSPAYGYPPGFGAPPPYSMPPQPGPGPDQPIGVSPQAEAAVPAPESMSDIFAALRRAPGTDRVEETPQ